MLDKVLKFISGAPKVTDDIFDKDTGHIAKAGEFLGKLVYTDEEEAATTVKRAELWLKYMDNKLEESTDRSKARRDLALLIIRFELLILFLGGILFPFNAGWSAVWITMATSGVMVMLVGGVAGFFYGTHLLRTKGG